MIKATMKSRIACIALALIIVSSSFVNSFATGSEGMSLDGGSSASSSDGSEAGGSDGSSDADGNGAGGSDGSSDADGNEAGSSDGSSEAEGSDGADGEGQGSESGDGQSGADGTGDSDGASGDGTDADSDNGETKAEGSIDDNTQTAPFVPEDATNQLTLLNQLQAMNIVINEAILEKNMVFYNLELATDDTTFSGIDIPVKVTLGSSNVNAENLEGEFDVYVSLPENIEYIGADEYIGCTIKKVEVDEQDYVKVSFDDLVSGSQTKNHVVFFYVKFPNGITPNGDQAVLESKIEFNGDEIDDEIYSTGERPSPLEITAVANPLNYELGNKAAATFAWFTPDASGIYDDIRFKLDLNSAQQTEGYGQIFTKGISVKDEITLLKGVTVEEGTFVTINGKRFVYQGDTFTQEDDDWTVQTGSRANSTDQTWLIKSLKYVKPTLGFLGNEKIEIEFELQTDEDNYVFISSSVFDIEIKDLKVTPEKVITVKPEEWLIKNDASVNYQDYFNTKESYTANQAEILLAEFGRGAGENETGGESAHLTKQIMQVTGNGAIEDEETGEISLEKIRYTSTGQTNVLFALGYFGNYQNGVIEEIVLTEEVGRSYETSNYSLANVHAGYYKGVGSVEVRYYYTSSGEDAVKVHEYAATKISNTSQNVTTAPPSNTYKTEIVLKDVQPNSKVSGDGGFEVLQWPLLLFKVKEDKNLPSNALHKVLDNKAFLTYKYEKEDGTIYESSEIQAEDSILYELPVAAMIGTNKGARSIDNKDHEYIDENGGKTTPFYAGNVVEYAISVTNSGATDIEIPEISDYMPTKYAKGGTVKYAAYIDSSTDVNAYLKVDIWKDPANVNDLELIYKTNIVSGQTGRTTTPVKVQHNIGNGTEECYKMVFNKDNILADQNKKLPAGKTLVIKYVVTLNDNLSAGSNVQNAYSVSSGSGSGGGGEEWVSSGSSEFEIASAIPEIHTRIYHKELNSDRTETVSLPSVKGYGVDYVIEADYVKMHGDKTKKIGGMMISTIGAVYNTSSLDTRIDFVEKSVKVIKADGEQIELTLGSDYGREMKTWSTGSYRKAWQIKYPLEEGDKVRIEMTYADVLDNDGTSRLEKIIGLSETVTFKNVDLTVQAAPLETNGKTPFKEILYKAGYSSGAGISQGGIFNIVYPTEYKKYYDKVAVVTNKSKLVFVNSQEEAIGFTKRVLSIDGEAYNGENIIELPSDTIIEYELEIQNSGSAISSMMYYDALPPGQQTTGYAKYLTSTSSAWEINKKMTVPSSMNPFHIYNEKFKRQFFYSATGYTFKVPADGWTKIRYSAIVNPKGVIVAENNPKNTYSNIQQLLEDKENANFLNHAFVAYQPTNTVKAKKALDGSIKLTEADLNSQDQNLYIMASYANAYMGLSSGAQVFYANAEVTYGNAKIRPGIEKVSENFSGDRVSPSTLMPWKITAHNDSDGKMNGFVVADVLPANMKISESSITYKKPATVKNDPEFRIVPWEDGKQLLIWEFDQGDYLQNGDSVEISFKTSLIDQSLLGNYMNYSYLIPREDFAKAMADGSGNQVGSISADIFSTNQNNIEEGSSYYWSSGSEIDSWKVAWKDNANGSVKAVYDSAPVQVFNPDSISGQKSVSSEDGTKTATSLKTIEAQVGETVTYTLEMSAGTKAAKITQIMDLLPYENDVATHTGQKRASAFDVKNAHDFSVSIVDKAGKSTSVAANQYTVKFGEGVANKGNWSESSSAWQASLEDNGIFLITFDNVTIPQEGKLLVTFKADVPKEYVPGLEKGSIAWNSFAYRYNSNGTIFTLEPPKAGVKIDYTHTGEIELNKKVIMHKSSKLESQDNKFYFNLLDKDNNILKFNDLGELDENGSEVIEVFVKDGLFSGISGSKTLTGLPPGRYSVKEINSGNLLYQYDITVDYENGENQFVELGNDGKGSIEVLNEEYRTDGKLIINKEVILVKSKNDAELPDKSFTFNVKDEAGKLVKFDETGAVSDEGSEDVVVAVSKNTGGIKGSVELTGLEAGKYTVVEITSGFSVKYVVSYDDKVQAESDSISIEKDKISSITVTNKEDNELGKLVINKNVILHKSDAETPIDKTFYFKVIGKDGYAVKFTDNVADTNGSTTIELHVEKRASSINGSVELSGLLPGTYTVREIVQDDSGRDYYNTVYEVSVSYENAGNAAITGYDETAVVTVENEEHQELGILKINKEVVLKASAEDADIPDSEFIFNVKKADGTLVSFDENGVVSDAEDADVNVVVTVSRNGGGIAGDVTLKGLLPGTYTVVELTTSLAVEYVVEYNNKEQEESDQIVIAYDNSYSVDVRNTEDSELGKIEINKNVVLHKSARADGSPYDEIFYFSIFDKNDNPVKFTNNVADEEGSEVVELTVARVERPNGEGGTIASIEGTLLLEGLLPGEYTVKELTEDSGQNPYYKTVYEVSVEYENSGAAAITKYDETATVTVENEEYQEFGKLTIDKEVILHKSASLESLVDAEFVFNVVDANSQLVKFNENGEVSGDELASSDVIVTVTKGNSNIAGSRTLTGLLPGKYIVKEMTTGLTLDYIVMYDEIAAKQQSEVQVAFDTTQTVKVTNEEVQVPGKLTIEKTVELVKSADYAELPDSQFRFNIIDDSDVAVTFDENGAVSNAESASSELILSVAKGENGISGSKTVTGLLPGKYTVVELTSGYKENYIVTYDGVLQASSDEITVEFDEEYTVHVNNKEDNELGKLKINKTVELHKSSSLETLIDETFYFTIFDKDNNAIKFTDYEVAENGSEFVELTVARGTGESDPSEILGEITLSGLPSGEYTVKELMRDATGKEYYNTVYDVRVTYHSGSVANVWYDSTVNVDVHNEEYQEPGKIKINKELILHKSASEEGLKDSVFTFQVKDAAENVVKFNNNGFVDANGSETVEITVTREGSGASGSILLEGFSQGTYTVEELNTGLSLEYDVKYNGDSEKDNESVTVSNDMTRPVTITNEEVRYPATIKIVKELVLLRALAEGAEPTDSVFTFRVLNEENEEVLFDSNNKVTTDPAEGSNRIELKVAKDADSDRIYGEVILDGFEAGKYTVQELSTGLTLRYNVKYNGASTSGADVTLALDEDFELVVENTQRRSTRPTDPVTPTGPTDPPEVINPPIEVDIEEGEVPLTNTGVEVVMPEPVPLTNREDEELPKTGDDASDMANMGFGAMFISMMGAFFALLFKKKKKNKNEEDWD